MTRAEHSRHVNDDKPVYVAAERKGEHSWHVNDDIVTACMDLVGRAGASWSSIGHVRDGVPVEDAGWWAAAGYDGAEIRVDEHRSPTGAALALAERLLRGATCRCTEPVALSDGADGCRWRLVGARWEPGCDAPPITVPGDRGDLPAMARAFGDRAARRGAGRNGGRR